MKHYYNTKVPSSEYIMILLYKSSQLWIYHDITIQKFPALNISWYYYTKVPSSEYILILPEKFDRDEDFLWNLSPEVDHALNKFKWKKFNSYKSFLAGTFYSSPDEVLYINSNQIPIITVSVISSGHIWKDGNAAFTKVSLNPFSDQ